MAEGGIMEDMVKTEVGKTLLWVRKMTSHLLCC